MSRFDRLYYKDAYLKKFTATVTACRQSEADIEAKAEAETGNNETGRNDARTRYMVELSQTAFYPEGGGQPADTGWLAEARVIDVQEQGDRVVHFTDRPLLVGSEVEGQIDWQRRFVFMQQHSGEHILSGFICAAHKCDNVGFHIGSNETTMDFNCKLTAADLLQVETLANQVVFANRPVTVCYPDSNSQTATEQVANGQTPLAYRSKIELGEEVRVVSIEDADNCACCGLHVRATGEIGLIKIVSSQNYKGGVRISIACGSRALEDYRLKNDQANLVSSQLSVKSTELDLGVERLRAEAATYKARATRLHRALIEYKAQAAAELTGPLCLFEEDATPDDLRQLCLRLIKDRSDVVAVLAEVTQSSEAPAGATEAQITETRWRYCVGSSVADMRVFSKNLNAAFNGSGGGNERLAQGTLIGSRSELETFISA